MADLYTRIVDGQQVNATNTNAPMTQLETAINATDAIADAVTAEVVQARNGLASLDARLDALVLGAPTSGAEVVDARGPFATLDARLDAMPIVKHAVSYGMTGTPNATDVANFQAMLDDATDGDVLYFPSGTYYITDSTGTDTGPRAETKAGQLAYITGIDHLKIIGDGDTIFASTDGGSGAWGGWFHILGCDHLEISGITFKNVLALTSDDRWQSADNALIIDQCVDVDIHHCVFDWMSNKHIHITGGVAGDPGLAQNIRIHDCEFMHSCYNSNPGGNEDTYYGSIFLYTLSTADCGSVSDVFIYGNHFHDNYMQCVTANNTAISTYPDQIVNLQVFHNIFEDSSGGCVLRGRNCKSAFNTYRNIGWSYISDPTLSTFYYYVTSSDGHRGYYSKTRSDHSGTAYDAPPNDEQCCTPKITSVLSISNSWDAHIYDEAFENCALEQILFTGDAEATAPILYAVSPLRLTVRGLVIDESEATAQVKTPMIYIVSSPVGTTIEGCRFKMNPVYGGSGTDGDLIRVDGTDIPAVQNNRATNWGIVHYSAIDRDRWHWQSAVPTAGTWPAGYIVWDEIPTSGQPIGWCCTQSGTEGTLNGGGTTGTIAAASTTLTVNDATGLTVGCFITVAGTTFDTGKAFAMVKTISGTTIVLNYTADSTVDPAGAVAFSNCVWKAFGTLA